jgi:hypothetical protein
MSRGCWHHQQLRLRSAALVAALRVGDTTTDPCSPTVTHTLRSYAREFGTAFLLRRTNNLALLLHDYVKHYCLVPHPMAVLGRKRM